MLFDNDGRIFINIHDECYEELKDFLISCCEPVSRTHHINEYRLTETSLSAAASEGTYDMQRIRRILQEYDMTNRTGTSTGKPLASLPPFIDSLLNAESSAEKISMVLQPNILQMRGLHDAKEGKGGEVMPMLSYHLQCADREYLSRIAADLGTTYLKPFHLGHSSNATFVVSDAELMTVGDMRQQNLASDDTCIVEREAGMTALQALWARRKQSKELKRVVVFKCEVQEGMQIQLREQLQKLQIRFQCSYDYARDTVTPNVPNFQLRHRVRLRPYQEASLERFKRGEKAHNGVIVLPCGAGKTLTGIAAASIIGKRVIILCCNVMSAHQWRDEFKQHTVLDDSQITMCVRNRKEMPGDIFITTYNMIAVARAKSESPSEEEKLTQEILDAVGQVTWGMLLLDEVHIAPAKKFRRVIDRVHHHCCLGLTATLLREDKKIDDIRFLIGPKLYEANWLELTECQFLAPVVCVEVRCPFPAAFLEKYVNSGANSSSSDNLRSVDIAAVSPHKLWVTQALIHFHLRRSPPDKVLIFCDSIAAILMYSKYLGIPFMDGSVSEKERATLVSYFKSPTSNVNVMMLSRVGDIALNIPEASVIIQISGLAGSRRQEAQRLGRILRAKPPSMDGTTAYFYSLVSEDTDETVYSFQRQQWLRDQGFSYEIIPAAKVIEEYTGGKRVSSAMGDPEPSSPLREQHIHRLPICVGRPRWYWLATGEERHSGVVAFMTGESSDGLRQTTTSIGWTPFADDVSKKIDDAFNHGAPEIELRKDMHGLAHHKHGRPAKTVDDIPCTRLIVQFSSARAPVSFGKVTAYAPKDTAGSEHAQVIHTGDASQFQFERCITKFVKAADVIPSRRHRLSSHNCANDRDCLQYALQTLEKTARENPSKKKKRQREDGLE